MNRCTAMLFIFKIYVHVKFGNLHFRTLFHAFLPVTNLLNLYSSRCIDISRDISYKKRRSHPQTALTDGVFFLVELHNIFCETGPQFLCVFRIQVMRYMYN